MLAGATGQRRSQTCTKCGGEVFANEFQGYGTLTEEGSVFWIVSRHQAPCGVACAGGRVEIGERRLGAFHDPGNPAAACPCGKVG